MPAQDPAVPEASRSSGIAISAQRALRPLRGSHRPTGSRPSVVCPPRAMNARRELKQTSSSASSRGPGATQEVALEHKNARSAETELRRDMAVHTFAAFIRNWRSALALPRLGSLRGWHAAQLDRRHPAGTDEALDEREDMPWR